VSARRKARKRALDVLFSADVREVDLATSLADATEQARLYPERDSSWPYAEEMVKGVLEHGRDIDELIRSTSTSWPLERMPAVDRAIVRLAVWELRHNPDVPPAVCIAEAVELATQLSTEASGGFVHGILAAIARHPE